MCVACEQPGVSRTARHHTQLIRVADGDPYIDYTFKTINKIIKIIPREKLTYLARRKFKAPRPRLAHASLEAVMASRAPRVPTAAHMHDEQSRTRGTREQRLREATRCTCCLW